MSVRDLIPLLFEYQNNAHQGRQVSVPPLDTELAVHLSYAVR